MPGRIQPTRGNTANQEVKKALRAWRSEWTFLTEPKLERSDREWNWKGHESERGRGGISTGINIKPPKNTEIAVRDGH